MSRTERQPDIGLGDGQCARHCHGRVQLIVAAQKERLPQLAEAWAHGGISSVGFDQQPAAQSRAVERPIARVIS